MAQVAIIDRNNRRKSCPGKIAWHPWIFVWPGPSGYLSCFQPKYVTQK